MDQPFPFEYPNESLKINIVQPYKLALLVASAEGPVFHDALSWDYI